MKLLLIAMAILCGMLNIAEATSYTFEQVATVQQDWRITAVMIDYNGPSVAWQASNVFNQDTFVNLRQVTSIDGGGFQMIDCCEPGPSLIGGTLQSPVNEQPILLRGTISLGPTPIHFAVTSPEGLQFLDNEGRPRLNTAAQFGGFTFQGQEYATASREQVNQQGQVAFLYHGGIWRATPLTTMPEPATLGLLLIGCLAMLAGRAVLA